MQQWQWGEWGRRRASRRRRCKSNILIMRRSGRVIHESARPEMRRGGSARRRGGGGCAGRQAGTQLLIPLAAASWMEVLPPLHVNRVLGRRLPASLTSPLTSSPAFQPSTFAAFCTAHRPAPGVQQQQQQQQWLLRLPSCTLVRKMKREEKTESPRG